MTYLTAGPHGGIYEGILTRWLKRAALYGEPTLALEPAGEDPYAVFAENEPMTALRGALAAAEKQGIRVWVRFASEFNLSNSPYSVMSRPQRAREYRRAARWLRSSMPKNLRLVYSPAINPVYAAREARGSRQLGVLRSLYDPDLYDRIGGTLYVNEHGAEELLSWYHAFTRRLDPKSALQICELGAPLSRKTEMLEFFRRVEAGAWPGLQRINLFAGETSARLQARHGRYGFLAPGQVHSYLRPVLGG